MTSFPHEACWIQALAETLGEEAARRFWSSLAPADPHTFVGTLEQALERQFGRHAGPGVAVRVGQALFHHLPVLHPHGADLPWRMSPVRQRVLRGLTWLIDEITPTLGLDAVAALSESGWSIKPRWRVPGNPLATAPHCGLWQGFFQEALYWLTGRVYPVLLRPSPVKGERRCTLFIPDQPLY